MALFFLRPGFAAVGVAAVLLAGCSGASSVDSVHPEVASTLPPEPTATTGPTVEVESVELPTGPRPTSSSASTTPKSTPTPTPTPTPTVSGSGKSLKTPKDEDEDEEKDNRCDGNITLDQDSEIRELVGNCGTVTITAKSVIVHIEKADRIVVTGNNNNIRADKVTKVEVKGDHNVLTLENVTDVTLTGNPNIANLSHRSGTLADKGRLNNVNG